MYTKALSMFLVALLVWTGPAPSTFAAVIGTGDYIAGQQRAALIDQVQAKLAREDVQQAMIRLGADPEEAKLRVDSLSDAELAQLDGQLDSLPAGGDVLALIGAVFLVLLILELVGVTHIFNRV